MTQAGSSQEIEQEHAPHLSHYLQILLRWRWIMICVPLAVVLCALIYLQFSTPIYRSECSIQLWSPGAKVLPGSAEYYDPTFGAATGGSLMVQKFLATQYEIILSRPNLEQTFVKMGFADKEEFKDAVDPLESFRRLFSVRGSRDSFLARVAFEWKDRQEARDTLACLISYYEESCWERAVHETTRGLAKLTAEGEDLRRKMDDKSNELQQFIVDHNISLESNTDIVRERLKALNAQLSDAERNRIESQSRYENIRNALRDNAVIEDLPEVVDSPTVRDLKLEYTRMKLLCSDLENSMGQNHPQVMAAQATVSAIADKLRIEVRSVLASAQNGYERYMQQEEQIRKALTEQTKAVTELNPVQSSYNRLKEEYRTLQETYRDLEMSQKQIEISQAASSNSGVYVTDPPSLPVKPAKPRKALSLVIALFVGLFMGAGLSFFADYLDTSIKTKEDVESLAGAAVLGYVPSLQKGQTDDEEEEYTGPLELIGLKRPRSGVAEVFRAIRTALSFTRTGSKCYQFVVTSALPSEGKTMVSVNVAIALAQTGKKVLLVDADLRRPRVHKVFGVANTPGLTNLLAGDEEFDIDDVVVAPVMETLSVIPSGPIPPNPAELLNGLRMGEMLRAFGERFDYVIFDTPPAINVTDSAVLAQRVSGALLVVRAFVTDKSAVSRARELLQRADARLLGVVMNGVDAPRGGYKYERYYYSYSYEYGEDGGKRKQRARSSAAAAKVS